MKIVFMVWIGGCSKFFLLPHIQFYDMDLKGGKNEQAVHILFKLNTDMKSFNTLYYKYILCTNAKF